MVLAKAFAELRSALSELARVVDRLRLEIEDEPRRPALADPFKYGAEDIEGWIKEAIADIDAIRDEGGASPDLDRGRLALASCNERVRHRNAETRRPARVRADRGARQLRRRARRPLGEGSR